MEVTFREFYSTGGQPLLSVIVPFLWEALGTTWQSLLMF